MARFKYLGEPPHAAIADWGTTHRIALPMSTGAKQIVEPSGDAFVIGEDIGVEVTDVLALAALRSDARFEEL